MRPCTNQSVAGSPVLPRSPPEPEDDSPDDDVAAPRRRAVDALTELFNRSVAGYYQQRPPAVPPSKLKTFVVNRRGERVPLQFDLITERNEELRSDPRYGPELAAIDSPAITAEVARRFRNGMSTRELDAETAAICYGLATRHVDYEWLTARIYVSDLHKRTPARLEEMIDALIAAAPDGADSLRLSPELIAVVRRASADIDDNIDPWRDYRFRFFGWQTLARSYLLRARPRREDISLLEDELMERPQHLFMRIALGIFVCRPDGRGHLAPPEEFYPRLEEAFKFYHAISLQCISNATPTLLNMGTKYAQGSSCFLTATGDDLGALFDTIGKMALISKRAGGVALWLHNVRAQGALIRGTMGLSAGIGGLLKLYEDTQLYANQGGNRPGAFAVYLSPDHADIFTFLRASKRVGAETQGAGVSAPRLKYALWVPNLFMDRLREQINDPTNPRAGEWHLFSPDRAPGLHLVWGEEYRRLYDQYVAEKRYERVVRAGDIIQEAFQSWQTGGVIYVCSKDRFNAKSNLQNVAPICSSNLCVEIGIPSWSQHDAAAMARFHPGNAAGGEFGVCNLAAICLESYLVAGAAGVPAALDYAGIVEAAALETRALNRMIDLTQYPSEECRRSNQRHRPIGVGIMGLADVYAAMHVPFGSRRALQIARAIAACVLYGCLRESAALAADEGPYATWEGSPDSRGLFQPDLWVACGEYPGLRGDSGGGGPAWPAEVEELTDGAIRAAAWEELRGVPKRNSLLTAFMPTATTSNIVGQNECFEPFTSNIYTRKTQAGEFFIVNRHLMRDLTALGLWDDAMRAELLRANGSVQGIAAIPDELRRRYRTAREISPGLITQTAAAMAPFVDQSMSLNVYFSDPVLSKILRFLFDNYDAGLKSLMYYCHFAPATGAAANRHGAKTATLSVPTPAPSAQPPVDADGPVCTRAMIEAGCESCAL